MKRERLTQLGLLTGLLFLLPWNAIPISSSTSDQQLTQVAQKAKPATGRSPDQPPLIRYGLEPKAIDLLKAASARLASARTISFTAVSGYESPSRLGTPLLYMTKSNVTLQRPNKLRVITLGDGPPSEFYYDGKTMMALAPADNLVAVAKAPATIDAMLNAAYDSAAIYFPFADFIVADPYKDLADGMTLAFYIGQSKVAGGTTTEMIAIANEKVFAQIWIGAEDKLPRLIRAVYADDRSRLRQQTEFSNWQLNTTVSTESFASPKARGATPIPFAHPSSTGASGKATVKQ